MFRVNPVEMFGALAAMVLGLGFFALIAYLVYLFVYKRIQMNHDLRMEMIKQGMAPRLEREGYGSLKAGIVSAAVGVGFLIALVIGADAERDQIGGEIVIALVPLLIGVGLVAFHLVTRKQMRREGTGYLSDSSES
jgi:uncharacterized membrane protein